MSYGSYLEVDDADRRRHTNPGAAADAHARAHTAAYSGCQCAGSATVLQFNRPTGFNRPSESPGAGQHRQALQVDSALPLHWQWQAPARRGLGAWGHGLVV
jgi:hypothetical protein